MPTGKSRGTERNAEIALVNERIWSALDTLAKQNGLSASGLALKAGLDATTFNPSKRRSSNGRLRWPSTESIARALDALGLEFADLAALIDNHQPPRS